AVQKIGSGGERTCSTGSQTRPHTGKKPAPMLGKRGSGPPRRSAPDPTVGLPAGFPLRTLTSAPPPRVLLARSPAPRLRLRRPSTTDGPVVPAPNPSVGTNSATLSLPST